MLSNTFWGLSVDNHSGIQIIVMRLQYKVCVLFYIEVCRLCSSRDFPPWTIGALSQIQWLAVKLMGTEFGSVCGDGKSIFLLQSSPYYAPSMWLSQVEATMEKAISVRRTSKQVDAIYGSLHNGTYSMSYLFWWKKMKLIASLFPGLIRMEYTMNIHFIHNRTLSIH